MQETCSPFLHRGGRFATISVTTFGMYSACIWVVGKIPILEPLRLKEQEEEEYKEASQKLARLELIERKWQTIKSGQSEEVEWSVEKEYKEIDAFMERFSSKEDLSLKEFREIYWEDITKNEINLRKIESKKKKFEETLIRESSPKGLINKIKTYLGLQ